MMTTRSQEHPTFVDDTGWIHLRGILTVSQAAALADECLEMLAAAGDDRRTGDKPFSGTRRLVDLTDRMPAMVEQITSHPTVARTVESVLGSNTVVGEFTFRCPWPGFGQQKLHADDLPLVDVEQTLGLTAIMPLVAFTPDNGATRLVPGSHRRADLQKLSGNLDGHPDEIVLTGPAGGMFMFSRHVLHSGTKNRSGQPRPAFQITWAPGRS